MEYLAQNRNNLCLFTTHKLNSFTNVLEKLRKNGRNPETFPKMNDSEQLQIIYLRMT